MKLIRLLIAVAVAWFLLTHLQLGHWLMLGAMVAMIVVHELGHWLLARLLGFEAPVFSIGFGSKPRILLGKIWGTEFQITAWLVGGYVALDPSDAGFRSQAAWKRAAVMVAGVTMNVVLAFVLMFFVYTVHTGLPVGAALLASANVIWSMGTALITGVLMMMHILPLPAGVPASAGDVHGVVGIVQMGQSALQHGFYNFLVLVSFISMNLAFFNILPIPMLDGGHLAFLAWEKITGKPVSKEMQGTLSAIFFALLMTLMLYGLFNDVFHPIAGHVVGHVQSQLGTIEPR